MPCLLSVSLNLMSCINWKILTLPKLVDQIISLVLFLIPVSNVLCGPLTYIFRKATQEGCFPASWKSANIVPIHKSDKKFSVSNYRPISLLPQIAKVFEKILCEQILSHVRPAISEQQHDFVSGIAPPTLLRYCRRYTVLLTRESSWILPTRIFQRPLIESTMISCHIKWNPTIFILIS